MNTNIKSRLSLTSIYFYLILSIIGGALIPLSLAPFDVSIFSFIAPLIFLYLCFSNFNIKKKLLLGLTFGLSQHLVGSSWIYVSIHNFGNANFILAGFLTFLFILTLSLYSILKISIISKYFCNKNIINVIIVFPFIWVLIDLLQSYLFTGFPWGFLGYAHLHTYLSGYAPIITVYGLTYLTVLIAAIFYYIFNNLTLSKIRTYYSVKNITLLLLVLLLFLTGNSLSKYNWTKPYDKPIKIALIQGNIEQLMKWDENHFKHIIETYIELTKNVWNYDLIIWPENAITMPIPYSNILLNKLAEKTKEYNSNLILGLPEESLINKSIYYNIAILLNKNTYFQPHTNENNAQIYQKKHLVPFGEYMPFSNYLRGIIDFFDLPMSDFSQGPNKQDLFKLNLNNKSTVQIAPFICFEIAYPFTVIENSKKANIILTISNDTWFGKSLGPYQHLQIAQMRALETGKPVIRATNNGITAVIDHKGRIIDKAPRFVEYTLKSEILPRKI